MFAFFLLHTLLPGTPLARAAGLASPVTVDSIQTYLRKNTVPDVESFLAALPEEFKKNYVMMIDSQELNDDGRRRIVERVGACEEPAVVVTHGTDTMVQTARAIAEASLASKTVVLTGAMVPYAFGSSDGLFNLGSALSFVQVLPPGVYVAMNGQYFPWNAVRKNTSTGWFELVNAQ